MIVGFRDDWLRAFFVDDVRSRSIPADLESRLFRKLQMVDDAMTDRDLRVRPAIISKSGAAPSTGCTRSASTSNGGWCFGGMAVRHRMFISMTAAIDEVADVDDQAQAGHGR